MTELSPAAQAVLYAVRRSYDHEQTRRAIAAEILRAVADQVQMKKPFGDTDADAGVFAAHQAIHTYLLTIATELES